MNRKRHRVVYNAARGQAMVVGETAASASAAPSTTRCSAGLSVQFPGRLPCLAVLLACIWVLPVKAQIVADPSAPGHQRPTILPAGNGVPVVNIQTPSAAGLSRNTYSQFDVGAGGAILNNSRTPVQTQLGGFISGNPWIGAPARVILNEVNSSHPSYLKGPVEVAGQRAEVIIANPSGIRVNGGTFLNASGVTLTTGTPVMNSGHLESFRVTQGTVMVEGLGLDTRTADRATILARAAEVNAGIWAEHLKLVTGANTVSADASTVTADPTSAQGTPPRFALDVAAIGGMYAGKIFLIGTEAGLGVNNGGVMSASAGDFVLEADGRLRNKGLIRSGGHLSVATDGIDNRDTRAANAAQPQGLIAQSMNLTTGELLNRGGNVIAEADLHIASAGRIDNTQGLVSAGGTLDIREGATPAARTLNITNTGGTLIADQQLAVAAKTLSLDGDLLSQQDMTLSVQGDHTHAQGSRIVANRDLTLDIENGELSNSGELAAGRHLAFTAESLDNTATGEISAGAATDIQVTADLSNRGLIDGQTTRIRADALHNIGTGRIYGDTLAIHADTLRNDTETVSGIRTDAVIAARSRLDVGARELLNREGATIFSAGDMAIGGALDANAQATGMAETVQNQSAAIEALGALSLATQTLENTNQHFTYTVAPVAGGGTAKVDYYAPSGYISGDDVGWSVVEYDGPYEYRDTTKSGTKILLKTSAYADPAFRAYYLGPTPFIEGHTVWWNDGETGGSYWVPDTYGHDRTSSIWAAFGLPQPAWDNPGQKPRTTYAADDSGQSYPPDPAAVADWEAKIAPWVELTTRYNAFKSTVAAQFIPINLLRSYTETEQRAEVTASQPARIVSGTDMALKIGPGGSGALNENSHIVAGGTLNVTGTTVTNRATQVSAPTLRSGTLSNWTVVGTDCSEFGCEPVYGWANAAYAETIDRTVSLPSSRYEANAASGQTPLAIGALRGATPVNGPTLTGSSLFTLHPGSTTTYLVETDPRFASYRQWLSSDYMLQAMSMDPATTQKRLGDGFYEQQLVREQIAALTGRRFLANYTSDDAQYQALMTNGATFAHAFQLRPGIALTAEQVARLTSDIVWLVSETVTLPDGSTQQVLVPRVYAIPREGDLSETGTLLAGQSVNLNLSGDLTNAGTIHGRQVTKITAENVHNLVGLLGGGTSTQITAQQDVNNIGGSISALEELRLGAGRDITVQSTTSQGVGDTGQGVYGSQGIDRVAGLYVSKDAGALIASAGGDVNLTAALIQSAGSVQVNATGDIKLGTVKTATSMDATRDERNYTRIEHAGEVGTQIQAVGSMEINAGQDVNARAATVQAGGVLDVQAARDVNITAGEQRLSIDTAAYARARSGLNSGSTELKDQRSDTTALSSSFGGEQVNIRSGQDTTVLGSSVIGDAGVNIQAGGDVNIVAAQTESTRSHFLEQKKSGFSFEGAGITYGSQRQSTEQDMQGTGSVASTVGAITGDVNITAGKTYTQTGSDVMAPGGDISIAAQDVKITEARETSRNEIEQQFEKSGITLAVSGPAVAAMQTISSQMEAASDTKDARMQGLAAANSAMALHKAVNDAKPSGGEGGDASTGVGMDLTLSIGSSSSESKSLETTNTARGSTVSAGGNVSITASGKGADSDILIRGSDVSAGNNASLSAEGDVNLLAAQNTASLAGSNKSDSGSVGISFGTSAGIGVTASVSSARGKEAGDDLIHTNTHITAGNQVTIKSGNDTTLQGALVKADTIKAEVGGDLKIESLQDTSTYDSQQQSMSASVTVGVAGGSGSFSASKSNISSDYASVAEQSGLKAGDGGFQVNVKGDTTLIGGAIASNQSAVENNLNSFNTGGELTTIDIQNKAEYSASSTSVGVGGGTDGRNKGISGVGVGVGSDSGNASSTTTAGISGIAGDTAIRSTDEETGIARIFEKETVQKEIDAQARITEAFSRQAPKAVASYAAGQERALQAQLDAESDPVKQEALKGEIDKWREGGAYRVALHTVAGAVGGGLSGAVGAAASGASANLLQSLQDNIQQGLEAAGLGDAVAKGIAQGIATLTAGGVGAAVGGAQGAASAATVDANNRQLHPTEKKLAQELAKKSNGKYTVEQIEEQMRLMGNKAFVGADANKTEALTTPEAIAENLRQDPNMPKFSDGKTLVEIPGQANAELQQYIIGNSTSGANYIPGQSPYVASNPALNRPSTTNGPSGTTSPTAKCANGDLACISGVGHQQNEPLTPQQQKAVGEFFGQASTNYQRTSTLFLALGQPNVALAYEVAAAVSGLLEQAFTPSAGKVVVDTLAVDTAAKVFSDASGIPLMFVNEVAEQLIKPKLQGLRDQIDQAGVGKK